MTSSRRKYQHPVIYNANLDPRHSESCLAEYAALSRNGAYQRASGRLYLHEDNTWSTKRHATVKDYLDLNVYDKIKVMGVPTITNNYHTRQVMECPYGVKKLYKNGRGVRNVFPGEVLRIDYPIGSAQRYNTISRPNTPINMNINLGKGIYDLRLILRAIQWNVRVETGGYATFEPFLAPAVISNTSVTVDAAVACIRNELTFRDRAVKRGLFGIKSEFKSGKHIFACRPPVECECSLHITKRMKAGSFHKRAKTMGESARLTTEIESYVDRCLTPLRDTFEAQVHTRSLNCSALSSGYLLHGVLELCARLMNDPSVVQIDAALVCVSAAMERSSNGLLSAHISALCEMWCWLAGTKHMSAPEQLSYAKKVMIPVLTSLVVSRRNFAQSGAFTQRSGSGCRQLFENEQRANMLRTYKKWSSGSVSTNKITQPMATGQFGKASGNKHRRLGIVGRATSDPYFLNKVRYEGLEEPTESEY